MLSRRDLVLSASAVALAAPHIIRTPAIAGAPIVRRDVMDMDVKDRFFSDYASAVRKMHELSNDNRSWLIQARIHADYCHHGELEFLHWHRHYIRFFETICAKLKWKIPSSHCLTGTGQKTRAEFQRLSLISRNSTSNTGTIPGNMSARPGGASTPSAVAVWTRPMV